MSTNTATPPIPGQARPRLGISLRPKLEEDPRRDDDVRDSATVDAPPAVVRFVSVTQEIESRESVMAMTTTSSCELDPSSSGIASEAQDALRVISQSLQRHRTGNFAFEPVSLPVSRVASNDTGSRPHSHAHSPALRPLEASMQSPPLTPTDAGQHEGSSMGPAVVVGPSGHDKLPPLDVAAMTPQTSPSLIPEVKDARERAQASSAPSSRPTTPSVSTSRHTPATSNTSSEVASPVRHRAKFSVGPATSVDSIPPGSERSSSSRSSSPTTGAVTENYTGSSTSFTRSSLLQGEKDDPYARSRRPPRSWGREGIDARFVFGVKDSKRSPASTHHSKSMTALPRQATAAIEGARPHADKHHSLAWRKEPALLRPSDETSPSGSKHASMLDLKRFFGLGHKSRRSASPSVIGGGGGGGGKASSKSGKSRPPSHQVSPSTVPFADDHGLTTRYGKFGKVLGSGAGGSVRLMRRSTDAVTFAVKEFRARYPYESEKDYAKKVTAEFCVGSTLHHGNVIETLDIVFENGRWYEVMEYAPYDLFAVVMTGKMSREEITCAFLQIFAGVTYLHSMGLCHRDLKLDNVVMTDKGIMKIIDFGSATVYRYPFESEIVLAQGVVGSDPYLAPEVFDNNQYDPQPTDIWSLAIIYCCMTLKRFPWKVPRMTDNSYKLFAAQASEDESTMEHVARQLHEHPKSTNDGSITVVRDEDGPESSSSTGESRKTDVDHDQHQHQDQRQHHQAPAPATAPSSSSATNPPATNNPTTTGSIKGPWRLLRLLPRESRPIIGRMLEVDPRLRASIDEMLLDPWVANSPVCRQEHDNRIVSAPGHLHTHTLTTLDSDSPNVVVDGQ